jgi:hypothetical protein
VGRKEGSRVGGIVGEWFFFARIRRVGERGSVLRKVKEVRDGGSEGEIGESSTTSEEGIDPRGRDSAIKTIDEEGDHEGVDGDHTWMLWCAEGCGEALGGVMEVIDKGGEGLSALATT